MIVVYINGTNAAGLIFKAVTSFYAKEVSMPFVKPMAPFWLCHNEPRRLFSNHFGPGVPSIELEVEGKDALWYVYGWNSMVEARPGVVCPGFVNGGSKCRASIDIGSKRTKCRITYCNLISDGPVGCCSPIQHSKHSLGELQLRHCLPSS